LTVVRWLGLLGTKACCCERTGRRAQRALQYVLFFITKRVDRVVQDFDAIKLLKFAVS
jgi:hypothetical protein